MDTLRSKTNASLSSLSFFFFFSVSSFSSFLGSFDVCRYRCSSCSCANWRFSSSVPDSNLTFGFVFLCRNASVVVAPRFKAGLGSRMDIARVRARGCANGRDGKEKELEFYWIPQNYGEEKEVKERKRGEKKCPFWKKERVVNISYSSNVRCAKISSYVCAFFLSYCLSRHGTHPTRSMNTSCA